MTAGPVLATAALERSDFDISGLRDASIPVVVEPGAGAVDLAAWAGGRVELLRSILLRYGAILFRGFKRHSPEGFRNLSDLFISDHFDYSFALTPRAQVTSNVTTSSEYPPEDVIPLHSECCAQPDWPLVILFFCETAPVRGGETPIADNRRRYQSLAPRLREKFERLGVMYVRNFSDESGLRLAFQTSDPAAIHAFCARNNYEFSQTGPASFRVRWIAPAIAEHPATGEKVWFNHVQTFHLSSLRFFRAPMPLEVFYADGSEIEDDVISRIRRTCRDTQTSRPWAEGDVLLLDNMLVSHGRNSFEGPRRILVAMGNSRSRIFR